MSDKELLALLMAEKSPAEIEALQKQLLIERLSGLLHTLLCPLNHTNGECDYYVPEISVEGSTSRKEWAWRTARICERADLQKADIELIILRLPSMITFLAREPAYLRFLIVIMPHLLDRAIADQVSQPEQPSSCQAGPSETAVLFGP
jgi:hypothetical protein